MFGSLTNNIDVEESGEYPFYFENADVETQISVSEGKVNEQFGNDGHISEQYSESDYYVDILSVTDKEGEEIEYDYNKTVELITSLI